LISSAKGSGNCPNFNCQLAIQSDVWHLICAASRHVWQHDCVMATETVPQSRLARRVFEQDAQPHTQHPADSIARNNSLSSLQDNRHLSWARLLLSEILTCYLRMKFLRERTSQHRSHDLPLLCRKCAAAGDRVCYTAVDHYTLHMQRIQSACPWIGWAEYVLVADAWKVALDTACCSCGTGRIQ